MTCTGQPCLAAPRPRIAGSCRTACRPPQRPRHPLPPPRSAHAATAVRQRADSLVPRPGECNRRAGALEGRFEIRRPLGARADSGPADIGLARWRAVLCDRRGADGAAPSRRLTPRTLAPGGGGPQPNDATEPPDHRWRFPGTALMCAGELLQDRAAALWPLARPRPRGHLAASRGRSSPSGAPTASWASGRELCERLSGGWRLTDACASGEVRPPPDQPLAGALQRAGQAGQDRQLQSRRAQTGDLGAALPPSEFGPSAHGGRMAHLASRSRALCSVAAVLLYLSGQRTGRTCRRERRPPAWS